MSVQPNPGNENDPGTTRVDRDATDQPTAHGGAATTTDVPAALQHALEQLRLEGAIFFRSEWTEGFAFESVPNAVAGALHPGAERLIVFHIVACGSCWVAGDDGERHWAGPGDVIVIPYGDRHDIGGDDAGGSRLGAATDGRAAVERASGHPSRRRRRTHRHRLRLPPLRPTRCSIPRCASSLPRSSCACRRARRRDGSKRASTTRSKMVRRRTRARA